MKKNNLKKLIGAITLGLAVTMGASIGGQMVKAMNTEVVSEVEAVESYDDYGLFNSEEQFGYTAYGVFHDGSTYYQSEQEIKDLVKVGFLTEREGELETKFLKATTDDEKDSIYKEIIDETKDLFGFTDDEAKKLKDAGYKNYNRVLDEIYYAQMVRDGVLTREEADLEIRYNAALTEGEREEVYDLMVENMVKKGEVTQEQGEKLKADGYKKYYDNMDEFDFQNMVEELFKEGAITKEQADKFKEGGSGEFWGEVCDLHEKFFMAKELVDAGVITKEKADEIVKSEDYESWNFLFDTYGKYSLDLAVGEGFMSREEADLWLAYIQAETDEEIAKTYDAILDYEVKAGIITQEEADFEREFGFEF